MSFESYHEAKMLFFTLLPLSRSLNTKLGKIKFSNKLTLYLKIDFKNLLFCLGKKMNNKILFSFCLLSVLGKYFFVSLILKKCILIKSFVYFIFLSHQLHKCFFMLLGYSWNSLNLHSCDVYGPSLLCKFFRNKKKKLKFNLKK